jgi:hypothetical protein
VNVVVIGGNRLIIRRQWRVDDQVMVPGIFELHPSRRAPIWRKPNHTRNFDDRMTSPSLGQPMYRWALAGRGVSPARASGRQAAEAQGHHEYDEVTHSLSPLAGELFVPYGPGCHSGGTVTVMRFEKIGASCGT